MKENKSIRIRTTPGGGDTSIGVKVTQEFDTIDFLSLKITQEEAYRNFCSDYGVIAGRVIANDGFGIQNAKISVFIPLSDEDAEDPNISFIYPYSTPLDKNGEGIRYNLLPNKGREFNVVILVPEGRTPDDYFANAGVTAFGTFTSGGWEPAPADFGEPTPGYDKYIRTVNGSGPKVPVGTFPSKTEMLQSDVLLEVYDKYYKFTTTTNGSGDYMIFGVPLGQTTVHMDVDLSDAGSATLTAQDLINIGFPSSAFKEEGDGNYSFKASTNLDELPQLEAQNLSVDVVPFWGDLEQCEVGITRLDFNLSKTISPSALLVFETFTNEGNLTMTNANNSNNIINGNDNDYSNIAKMQNLGVGVEAIAMNPNGRDVSPLEYQDGKVIFPIPMYEKRKVTNEFGEIVEGDDTNGIGIPTAGKYNIYVFALDGNVTGAEIEGGYANHVFETVTYRYDLLNGERMIYTASFFTSGTQREDTLSNNGGNHQPFPVTFKQFGSHPKNVFGFVGSNQNWLQSELIIRAKKTPVCYGSLYFPRFKFGYTNDGVSFKVNSKFARNITQDVGQLSTNGGILGYLGNPSDADNNCKFGTKGVLNITKLKNEFKPFGGGLDTTSASLNIFAGPPITDPSALPDVDLSNMTIPINSSSGPGNSDGDVLFTTNNPVYNDQIAPSDVYQDNSLFPGGALSMADNANTPQTGASGEFSKRGRYFFYFGLKKDNTVLDKLRDSF